MSCPMAVSLKNNARNEIAKQDRVVDRMISCRERVNGNQTHLYAIRVHLQVVQFFDLRFFGESLVLALLHVPKRVRLRSRPICFGLATGEPWSSIREFSNAVGFGSRLMTAVVGKELRQPVSNKVDSLVARRLQM